MFSCSNYMACSLLMDWRYIHKECAPKESNIVLFNISSQVWCVFYMFIQAILLLTMNTAIVAKLKKAQSTHFSLTSITRSSVSLNSPIVTDDGFHIETETQRNFGNGPAWWQKQYLLPQSRNHNKQQPSQSQVCTKLKILHAPSGLLTY